MGVNKSKRPFLGTATPGYSGDGSGLTGVPSTGLVGNTAIGHSARRVAHAQYSFAVDGGAIGLITPASTAAIPQNAVITNVSINSTTAVTSAGSATISVGLSAGAGGAAAILAATGKASFTLNGFVQAIPVPQDVTKWIKMSAAGNITLTVAVAALTAGVIEVYVDYFVSGT